MKMAKKVLSVVLAVLMALSCFAVASSAYVGVDADTATKHATLWMTAGVDAGSQKSTVTSNTKFTFTDPSDTEATEVTAAGGDTVYVYLYATTDYYIGTFAVDILVPAGWQTPSEKLHAIAPTKNFSNANLKKIYMAGENELMEVYPWAMTSVLTDDWSKMAAANVADTAKAWPTDANGAVLADFANGDGTPNTAKWKFVRFSHMVSADAEYAVEMTDDSTYVLRLPLYIPANVADGTYQILISENEFARPEKTKGFNVIAELADPEEGCEDDEISEGRIANKWLYNASEQCIDCSGACITVTIGEDAPTLDYTALDEAIADFEALTESDWTAQSWAAADAKYDAAVAAKTDATTQAEIDAAAADLAAAIDALEEAAAPLDYTALEAAIADAQSRTPDDYTIASWTVVNSKIDDYTGFVATTQDEIDAAAADLTAALNALVLAADLTGLRAALAAYNAADEADYDSAVWANIEGLVETGEEYLLDDLSIEDQSVVDALANKLDKTALEAAIAEAEDILNDADPANYTADSWTAFTSAKDAADAAMSSTSQEAITNAATALTDAINGLTEADADYTALNALIAEADELKEADYKAGWDAFASALTEAKAVPTGLKAKDQATINEAADALNAAIGNLTPWGDADTAELVKELNTIPEYDEYYYTEDSMMALFATLDAGMALMEKELTEADQADIDAAAAAIKAAREALELKPADTDNLFAAIDAAANINPEYVESTDELDAAVAAAWELLGNDLTILDQDAVTDKANDITYAIDNLSWLTADYSALDEAKEIVETLVPEFYVPELLDDVMTAYNTACDVPADLLKADQWKVDAAAETLWNALDALEMLPADYTAVNAAITAANKVKETTKKSSTEIFNNYTDDSWAAFATAKATAEALDADRYIEYQGEIDAAAAALTEAQANLVWAAFPYEELANPVLAEIAALDETNYTADSWANLMAKVDALDEDLTMENFTKGMQQITAINTAKKNLVEYVPEGADYDALDAAIGRFESLTQSDWTGDSWALAVTAYEYALGIERDLTADSQGVIDDAAAALNDAIDNLVAYVEPAIKTALKAAIDRAKDYGDYSIYTDETVEAVTEAYRAAVALYEDETLTFEDQDAIDEAANALNDALDNLELKPVLADVTALQAAIEAAENLTADDYTEETWSVLAEAVTTGQALARAELEDSEAARQAIAEATEAIYDAIDALEEKPAEPAKGDVQKVEVTSEPVVAGEAQTFEVTVKDRAMMVQFIEADHGEGTGTRTFDRYNENVTIKSYKADGTECSSLDRELAYEVWTINTKLADGEIDVRVKKNGSTLYEPVDNALRFVNEYKALNNEIISAELAATSGAKGPVAYTVVAGADVQAIQFKNQEGETFTMPVEKAADNGDGTLTFTGKVWFHSTGVRTVTLKALDANNGWVDTGITLEYTIG